ncbi:MAG TPA: glycoside hydrolase family 3 C-terminal domain-containing protein [Microlunatus sp.]
MPDALDVDAVVAQLTLEEKASLTMGSGFWYTAAVERLGVERILVSDGPHGLRAQPAGHSDGGDHLGIGGSVPATCFPTASGLASSWNPEAFRAVGRALAREARAGGVAVVLGPGVNIKRSPLCGRNFEYLSEDPYLAGALATAAVQGTQSLGVGTSLKHYAANNQEGDRLRVSAEVDDRTLREIYLPAFEAVVTDARPWTVMCAYNRINGTYASEHHWLLTEVLRDEWGFEGLVVSDWGAVHDRVAALAAGLDLEMPPAVGVSDVAVVEAVRAGTLEVEVLDEAVRRVLRLVERSRPAMEAGGTFDVHEHHALARTVAHESAVLLKNDGGVLPLRPAAGARVAVIGEFARTPRYQGAGSSQVNPTRVDIPLDELSAAFGTGVTVDFAPGFLLNSVEDDDALLVEAIATATDADHVVVFLGLPVQSESEGFDRTTMELPANQITLLQRISAVSDSVVVVLVGGSTVQLSTWDHRAAAILNCWLSGQASGGAVADLLTGAANPSGKLAETIPIRLEDNSSFLNFPGDPGVVRYGEGVFVGYRGYDKAVVDVSYPFGYGLSYTSFSIGDVSASVSGSVADGDLSVAVIATVTNIGSVAGAEVVQVYVGDLESEVARPVRELKGFVRVGLEPGASTTVTVHLDERAFAYWSVRLGRWAVEAGEFEIAVGSSSRDIADQVVVSIDAPSVAAPLGVDSTLHEWLADDRGRELLSGAPGSGTILQDPELIKIVGTFPMSSLAAFGQMGWSRDQLDQLIAAL